MIEAAPFESEDVGQSDGSLKVLEKDDILNPTADTTGVDIKEEPKKGGGAKPRPVFRPPVRYPMSPGRNSASSKSWQTGLLVLPFLLFFAAM